MKANRAMFILGVTRPTLKRYRDQGLIKATKLSSGQYDYDANSVYELKNGGTVRRNVIYARVSTHQQRVELDRQIVCVKNYAKNNGYKIDSIYSDIASGISFKNRNGLSTLLTYVLEGKINKVFVLSSDRLSRTDFSLYRSLFKRYDTQIVCVRSSSDVMIDKEEFSHDLRDYLNGFSTSIFTDDARTFSE